MSGSSHSGRIAVSGLVWALCTPAAMLHLFAVIVCLMALPGGGATPADSARLVLICAAIIIGGGAWYTLQRMNRYWLDNRPLHWRMPALCAACAVIGIVPLAKVWYVPVALASPGIAFAIYLSIWHLRAHSAAARTAKN